MVTPEFAAEQIIRLAQLNYYPREDDYAPALRELVEAARGADSEDCLKQAIAQILYDAEDCPKPADIRRVVRIENERSREIAESQKREAAIRPQDLCPFCRGTHWAVRTYVIIKSTEEIDGFVRLKISKRYLLNEEEIKEARISLQPDQEILEGVEKCSCSSKSAS